MVVNLSVQIDASDVIEMLELIDDIIYRGNPPVRDHYLDHIDWIRLCVSGIIDPKFNCGTLGYPDWLIYDKLYWERTVRIEDYWGVMLHQLQLLRWPAFPPAMVTIKRRVRHIKITWWPRSGGKMGWTLRFHQWQRQLGIWHQCPIRCKRGIYLECMCSYLYSYRIDRVNFDREREYVRDIAGITKERTHIRLCW